MARTKEVARLTTGGKKPQRSIYKEATTEEEDVSDDYVDSKPKVKPQSKKRTRTSSKKTEAKKDISASAAKQGNDAEDKGEGSSKKQKTGGTAVQSKVDWLLSEEALHLAYPPLPQGTGEIDFPQDPHQRQPPEESAGKDGTTSKEPSTKEEDKKDEFLAYPLVPLTPFLTLLSTLLLSKPLSHNLQLRTVNTILNPPFNLRTVAALKEAGEEGIRNAIWESRTQHKEKTAAQMWQLVEDVIDMEGTEGADADNLTKLREKAKEVGVEKAITAFKGIGPTGATIFERRIQEWWEEVYPYSDDRGLQAAVELGLIEEGEDAKALAEAINGDQNDEQERAKLARLLDIMIGLQLEKKLDQVPN